MNINCIRSKLAIATHIHISGETHEIQYSNPNNCISIVEWMTINNQTHIDSEDMKHCDGEDYCLVANNRTYTGSEIDVLINNHKESVIFYVMEMKEI